MPSYFVGAYSNQSKKNKAKTNQKPSNVESKAKESHSLLKVKSTDADKLAQMDQVKMGENASTSPSNDTKPVVADLSPELMAIQQINKELIKIQHPDLESVYLYLLNNVSILENDLLEAHKHYNETTHNWLSNHQNLCLMLRSQMVDVKQYTNQLLDLLAGQQKEIGNLIESVNRFCTGLEQLQQSVEDNVDG